MTSRLQHSKSPWMTLARIFYFFVTPVLVVGGGIAVATMVGLPPELGALLGFVSAVVQVLVAMDVSEASRRAAAAADDTRLRTSRKKGPAGDAALPAVLSAEPGMSEMVQAHDSYVAAMRRMRVRQEEIRAIRDETGSPEERAHATGWMAAMHELAATVVDEGTRPSTDARSRPVQE